MKTYNRLNEENYNSFGSLMQIKEYRRNDDIDVYFPEYDYYAINRTYLEFKKGTIKCPFEPRVCGIGYHGCGPYKIIKQDEKQIIWNNMISRCYKNNQDKNKTYQICTVCEDWHNFQNFAQWYEDNYYEVPGEKMFLDKDILIKGNKEYSPQTCVFVPRKINNLFTLRQNKRANLPLGVKNAGSANKTNPYIASITKDNKKITIGYFKTINEAFDAYKQEKEDYIKAVAEEYSLYIPDVLYNALINWEIEIND